MSDLDTPLPLAFPISGRRKTSRESGPSSCARPAHGKRARETGECGKCVLTPDMFDVLSWLVRRNFKQPTRSQFEIHESKSRRMRTIAVKQTACTSLMQATDSSVRLKPPGEMGVGPIRLGTDPGVGCVLVVWTQFRWGVWRGT